VPWSEVAVLQDACGADEGDGHGGPTPALHYFSCRPNLLPVGDGGFRQLQAALLPLIHHLGGEPGARLPDSVHCHAHHCLRTNEDNAAFAHKVCCAIPRVIRQGAGETPSRLVEPRGIIGGGTSSTGLVTTGAWAW
jgi:hypothetical protein